MREFTVCFLDRKTGKPRKTRVKASDYGEPLAKAVEAIGGDPETISSVWEV